MTSNRTRAMEANLALDAWTGEPPNDATRDSAVAEFMMTMPRRYLERFGRSAIRAHAFIASTRGAQPAQVGLFETGDVGEPALCVVAPDRLGLLSVISASLLIEGFDITDAEAYTRRTLDGRFEAVDLFWVRREEAAVSPTLTNHAATALRATLLELLDKKGALPPLRRRASRSTPGAAETRVRFVEHWSEPHMTLELETNDRPGLLFAVTTALFAENVLITSSQVTTRGQRVHDSFDLVEADGTAISGTRLQRIQLAVLGAIDSPP